MIYLVLNISKIILLGIFIVTKPNNTVRNNVLHEIVQFYIKDFKIWYTKVSIPKTVQKKLKRKH